MPEKVIIQKVTSREEIKDFARFANRLYRNCPQYIPEMESEIESSLQSPTEGAEVQALWLSTTASL